ncbi:MAG: hypothetical protein LC624_06855 [Halobacteriales archaeon]|nr:hypothetical protein [Halobacteriales archaeon]
MSTARSAALVGLLLLSVFGTGIATMGVASVQEILAFDPASDAWSTRVTEPGFTDSTPPPPLATHWRAIGPGTDATIPVFGNEVRASGSDHMGEPGVKIANDGTIYVHAPGFLWVSTDSGATFHSINLQGVRLCGCDADLAVNDLNEAFYSDLNYPVGGSIGATLNQGATFVPGGLVVQQGSDRQWIESDGLLHTYFTLRSGGVIDGYVATGPAHEFAPLGQLNVQGSNFRAGYLAVDRGLSRDPTGYAYFTYTSGNSVRVVVTQAGGLIGGSKVLSSDHLVASTGGTNLDSFSAAAVDDAGNAYVVWSEQASVAGHIVTKSMMASSTDHGATWSAGHQVNSAPATSVYPWIVAGKDGSVGIVYYGSAQATTPGSVTGDWFVYYTYSANAHDANPAFTETVAVPHKVRTGAICTGGTGCGGGSRAFLDFFGVTQFPDGRAAIAYDDSEALPSSAYPYVHFIQQVDGPKLR